MAKLVNLGSLCIDNVYGVPNIAASGETVASTSYDVFPGGKGLNQSLAAAKAGAEVTHFGCVGRDGALLRQVLAEAGVGVEGIREVDGPSGHAVIQVDAAGRNAIVIQGGANRHVAAADIEAALSGATPEDWLLLQNEINDIDIVLERAAASKVRVAFNVAPVDARVPGYDLSGVDLLIVNEVEAAALAGVTAPDAALHVLCERYPATAVVLTLGADGLRFGRGAERLALAAFVVEAVDETAAGDAFIGYLMGAMLSDRGLERALRIASAAGALAVTRHGAATSIPDPAEVLALAGAAD